MDALADNPILFWNPVWAAWLSVAYAVLFNMPLIRGRSDLINHGWRGCYVHHGKFYQ